VLEGCDGFIRPDDLEGHVERWHRAMIDGRPPQPRTS